MNDWMFISFVFGSLALLALTYKPKMLVEDKNGIVTYEDTEEDRPTIPKRLRVILALAIAWTIVMLVDYHEHAWRFLQEYLKA